MKFAVGIMLTTFGIFWSAEGAGADWPGGDAAILGVLAFVVLWSADARLAAAPAPRPAGRRMSVSPAFGRFWWNFIVGDDWLAAAGVAVALAVTALVEILVDSPARGRARARRLALPRDTHIRRELTSRS